MIITNLHLKQFGLYYRFRIKASKLNLLIELHCPLTGATIVFRDNVSAVYLASSIVQHGRTKHVEIDFHFVREHVVFGHVRVLLVSSSHQFADIFTKGTTYTIIS